jgi:hypothetical protein
MLTLFDDIARTDPRPAKHAESHFRFLNRVDSPYFAAARELLDDWFTRFPPEGRKDLRARFRSDDPGQSIGAFWELYLHEVHLRLGFELERDPEVPGTTKRPDFLARRGNDVFYLEATLVSYADAEKAARQREAIVLDLVNEAFDPDFWVSIRINVPGESRPSRADVVRPIETWLGGLNWETEHAGIQRPGYERHTLRFPARDWVLTLRALPKPPKLRGDRAVPTIAMGPVRTGYVDERRHVEADLRAKSTRYGKPDAPFVIAVLCVRDFVSEEEIEGALYGPEVVKVPVGPNPDDEVGEPYAYRDPRGLWQRGSEQRATRVSAVLSAVHLVGWSVASVGPTLWKNPWAAKPLTADVPWRTVTGDLQANQLVRTDATAAPHEVLGLPLDWPGGEPFPR